MTWILLLAGFTLGAAIVSFIFYRLFNPKTLTTEGEGFDLTLTLGLVAMIVFTAAAVSSMFLLGRLYLPLELGG